MKIAITPGRQVVNDAQLVKFGDVYILTADLATKRAGLFIIDHEANAHQVMLVSSDGTLHEDETKTENTVINVEGVDPELLCYGFISRYTLTAFFYPRSVYDPKNSNIVADAGGKK